MASVRAPRAENAANLNEHDFQVDGFLLEQRPDVSARSGPRAAQGDGVLDLRECQAEPTRLADEGQQLQYLVWVTPVAGQFATRRRQNAPRFVQP